MKTKKINTVVKIALFAILISFASCKKENIEPSTNCTTTTEEVRFVLKITVQDWYQTYSDSVIAGFIGYIEAECKFADTLIVNDNVLAFDENAINDTVYSESGNPIPTFNYTINIKKNDKIRFKYLYSNNHSNTTRNYVRIIDTKTGETITDVNFATIQELDARYRSNVECESCDYRDDYEYNEVTIEYK